jgi:type I restriction enzyme S subunit
MRAETTFDRRITKDDFRELPVLIPPLAYQGAIARYLDVETMRIDELLGALRRLDAATADRAQAETAQACDGASVRVKNLVTKIGSGKTPSGGSEAYVSQGVALLRSMNVRNGFFDLSDVAYIDADTDLAMASTRLRAGDVLLTITGGSIGRSAVVPQDIGPANVNQHVCILRPKSGVPSPLLSAALLTPAVQGQISAVQVGGNRDGLTFEQVGELLLPWPASDLARAEARVEVALASSARIHAAVASQIDLLLERRQAVITASVTGQIEIPGVAA